jgi:uncharacterized protein (TIGR01777 family)
LLVKEEIGVSIEHSSTIGHSIEDVFVWHERPGALARLLPPWQPIEVETEAVSLAEGTAVLRLPGGIRWVARHSDYDPPRRFVDDLVSLPLPWRHVHTFEAEGPRATRVTDTVTTPVPASLLRPTFVYRHLQLADDLEAIAGLRRLGPTSSTVAITGSSGLIGTALRAFLSSAGYRVVRLVRRRPVSEDERAWDVAAPDPAVFEGVDAVVHLAGATIAGRFSEAHKTAIATSRIEPTRRLVDALVRSGGPRVLLASSAIGYYGPDRGDELLEEAADPGRGFLADVVARWEHATQAAAEGGVRVVTVRTGVVLSARGGMLKALRPIFSAGLGGRIGDGRQWISWIDLDDLTDVYARALVDARIDGVLNAVSPFPVRNEDLTATLARVLRRPALLHVPEPALRALLGTEGVRELARASQRVTPGRLHALGFRFRRPGLEASLRHQLGRIRAASQQ